MEGVEVGQGEEVAVDLEVQRVVAEKGTSRGGSRVVLQRGGSRKAGSSKSGSSSKSVKPSLHQVKKKKMRD